MNDKHTEDFDFGELRSIVQGAPGEERWRELCALLTPAQAERYAERWLPYAARALDERWPDALRAASLEWIKRKRPPVMAQLARSLRIAALSANALNQLLVMLERGALPLTMLDVAQDIPHTRGQAHPLWDVQEHPLHTLALSSISLSDALCRQIAASQATQALAQLTITAGRPTETGLRELCGMGAIKKLELRAWSGQHGEQIGRALYEAKCWKNLGSLHTTATSLRGAVRPMMHALWPVLRELRCDRADLTHMELRALLDCAPNLGSLSLPVSSVRSEWFKVIMRSAVRLNTLDLSWSKPEPGDLAALLQSAPCAGLRALTLRDVTIDADATQAICAHTPLERLDLGHATLDASFWDTLRGASLPALETLDLSAQHVGLERAHALSAASLPALNALKLSAERVTKEAAALLRESPRHQALHLSS